MSEWYEVAVMFVLGAGCGAAILYVVLFYFDTKPTDADVAAWIEECQHEAGFVHCDDDTHRCFLCGATAEWRRDTQ